MIFRDLQDLLRVRPRLLKPEGIRKQHKQRASLANDFFAVQIIRKVNEASSSKNYYFWKNTIIRTECLSLFTCRLIPAKLFIVNDFLLLYWLHFYFMKLIIDNCLTKLNWNYQNTHYIWTVFEQKVE